MLICFIVCVLLYVDQHPITYDTTQYINAIVIDKSDCYMLGDIMTVKFNNDSIVEFRCYDIVFDNYKIGDTIK